ncbi:hypothetical protein AND_006937 [Anopheles darlingi]|uniref:Secreted protein n=1 Tax=Anopheles darlingi TaxID=43151 RepID=W5JF44_ANODA|nr:hypothetical protein AND_006937 [Anopheles darlingi]
MERRSLSLVALVLLPLVVQQPPATEAHVALTFPPARKYDLDFLDNSRTKAPCGMPKGSLKTSFIEGSTFNVSWHLAYPHRPELSRNTPGLGIRFEACGVVVVARRFEAVPFRIAVSIGN